MFNKSYYEGEVVYHSVNLPLPDLIREEQLKQVLTSLDYTVMDDDDKRNKPIKSTDFLCSDIDPTLRARNRGWETQIEVERRIGNPSYWIIEVRGNPKKENDLKKIADALEIATYKEAKKLAESTGTNSSMWKDLPTLYGNILFEEKIRIK